MFWKCLFSAVFTLLGFFLSSLIVLFSFSLPIDTLKMLSRKSSQANSQRSSLCHNFFNHTSYSVLLMSVVELPPLLIYISLFAKNPAKVCVTKIPEDLGKKIYISSPFPNKSSSHMLSCLICSIMTNLNFLNK